MAVAHLVASDPLLAKAHAAAGAPHFKMRRPGFESLLKVIVEQQVSTASARAIWARLESAVTPLTPETLLSAAPETLRGAGLSAPKARYARELAGDVTSGRLNLNGLARMSDDNAMAALQSVIGIGRWTAEIYLLFCLGRPDVWPAGDVAVQAALQMLAGYKTRPDAQKMDELAENWRPLRGVAALLLWSYYRHIKQRPLWE